MSVRVEGCRRVRETDNAVLIDYEGDEVWLPLSQVERMGFNQSTGMGYIVISDWIAQQKGLGE